MDSWTSVIAAQLIPDGLPGDTSCLRVVANSSGTLRACVLHLLCGITKLHMVTRPAEGRKLLLLFNDSGRACLSPHQKPTATYFLMQDVGSCWGGLPELNKRAELS